MGGCPGEVVRVDDLDVGAVVTQELRDGGRLDPVREAVELRDEEHPASAVDTLGYVHRLLIDRRADLVETNV